MPARVDLSYDQGFFLSEENLVKLDDFVRKRLGDCTDFTMKYEVSRVDHAIVFYDRPADVVSEENSVREEIKSVKIQSECEVGYVRLSFTKGEGTDISLGADDRDLALLLSSDVKDYIKAEVLRGGIARFSSWLDSRLIFLIAMTLGLFGMVLITWWSIPKAPKFNVHTASAMEKLDYLVNRSQERSDITLFPLGLIFPFLLMFVIWLIASTTRPLFPAYTFYWGKEINRYDRMKTIRGQLFWVVLVGLIVALIGSYIFNVIPH